MKVKELIEILSRELPDKEIYMASDAEGNEYTPLQDVSDQVVVKRGNADNDMYNKDEPEEYEGEETEEVLVFWRA